METDSEIKFNLPAMPHIESSPYLSKRSVTRISLQPIKAERWRL